MALHNLIQAVKEPYYMVKEAVEEIVPAIEKIAEEMRQKGMELKNQVKNVVHVIKKAMIWLKAVADVCKKSKATPFDQCSKAFETTIVSCR